MRPFFAANPEAIAALRAEAQRWLGTPFRARSCVCGPQGGVDCVRLGAALLMAAGALPTLEFPRYQIDAGSHVEISPLLAFLRGGAATADSRTVGAHLAEYSTDEPVQPGDVIALTAGRTPYHLGVVLTEDGDFIHVLIRKQVIISSLRDSTYAESLQALFRPVARKVQD